MKIFTENEGTSRPFVIYDIVIDQPDPQPEEVEPEVAKEKPYAQCPRCGDHEATPWPLEKKIYSFLK